MLPADQMNLLYNSTDCQILLTNNEGWGLSLTEAILCGNPIIANVTGGMQDQMRFSINNKWVDFSADFPSNHKGTIKEYNKLCEQWWYERAHEAVESGQSNKFNQRLWLQIVKNKFRDNWKDEKQIDVTTQGDKISDNKSIQIEIIQPKDDGI